MAKCQEFNYDPELTMRVLMSIKWVLGFAASSGLVLAFGGNAFAADAGTNSAPQAAQETTVAEKPQGQTAVSTSVVTISVHETSLPATGPELTKPVKPVDTAAAPLPGAPVAQPNTSTASVSAAATVAPNEVQPTTTAPVVMTVPVSPVTEPQAVQYQPLHMTVQPVITSARPVQANDLASDIPTAVAPASNDHSPVPAQPTGVLGQLSAQLAGSVVRQVYVPTVTLAGLATLITLMIFLILLTVGTIEAAFGINTRRDGYAHAPRSDVAAATFNFLFATPSSLSYVTATRRRVAHF